MTEADPLLHRMQAELAALRLELAACRLREMAALRAAQVDALTGLPNRRLFDQQVGRQLLRHGAQDGRLALLFLDLDGFKAINDRHGHAVGDALLKVVGLRLRHTVREQDLVCRLGGDEFVCVLFNLHTEEEVEAIERKVHAAISQPCHMDTLTVTIRPSIGAAQFPRDGASAPDLLAHADRAMYRAKQHRLRLVPPTLQVVVAEAAPSGSPARLQTR